MFFDRAGNRTVLSVRGLSALALALCSTLACSSSTETLYKKAASTATYHQASYEHNCQGTGHPPADCKPCEAVLARAAWQVQTATTNVKIGYMDPKEIADLKQLLKDLEQCP